VFGQKNSLPPIECCASPNRRSHSAAIRSAFPSLLEADLFYFDCFFIKIPQQAVGYPAFILRDFSIYFKAVEADTWVPIYVSIVVIVRPARDQTSMRQIPSVAAGRACSAEASDRGSRHRDKFGICHKYYSRCGRVASPDRKPV